jgi:hypothetical protein
VQGSLQCLP